MKQVQNHRHTAYGNTSLFAQSEHELSELSATTESPLLEEPPFQFSMEAWLIIGMCGLLLLLVTVVCCAVRCRNRGNANLVDMPYELQPLHFRKKVVMDMSEVRWHVCFWSFITCLYFCVNNCESPTQVSLICLLKLVVYLDVNLTEGKSLLNNVGQVLLTFDPETDLVQFAACVGACGRLKYYWGCQKPYTLKCLLSLSE